jgi:hypothetical protein
LQTSFVLLSDRLSPVGSFLDLLYLGQIKNGSSSSKRLKVTSMIQLYSFSTLSLNDMCVHANLSHILINFFLQMIPWLQNLAIEENCNCSLWVDRVQNEIEAPLLRHIVEDIVPEVRKSAEDNKSTLLSQANDLIKDNFKLYYTVSKMV